MIGGYVNRDLEPVVPIEIEDSTGSFQSYDVVLDTGFTGELMLPRQAIERLGLTYRGEVDGWTSAVGEETSFSAYDGVVIWHGQTRKVVILENNREPLLGTSLLSGSKIYIDMKSGGEVQIEEDWPT